MKRSPALTPLSHDHHKALFVAQRLRRAESVKEGKDEFAEYWRTHGRAHFRAEEEVLLPMWQALGHADAEHVGRVANEHMRIRCYAFELAEGEAELSELNRLGELLQAHVRYEERELFPLIEDDLDPQSLERVAAALDAAEAG